MSLTEDQWGTIWDCVNDGRRIGRRVVAARSIKAVAADLDIVVSRMIEFIPESTLTKEEDEKLREIRSEFYRTTQAFRDVAEKIWQEHYQQEADIDGLLSSIQDK